MRHLMSDRLLRFSDTLKPLSLPLVKVFVATATRSLSRTFKDGPLNGIAGFNEFWLAVLVLVPAEMPIRVSIG